MVCSLADFPVLGSGWLSHLPHPWFLPKVNVQFHRVASGSGPTFIPLGWECFALFGLVSDTGLHLFTTTLDLCWKDLLMKVVVMVCLCLMNSTTIFFNDG